MQLNEEEAKVEEEVVCSKCQGTGWYSYDESHSTVCNKCCKHDGGWWELTEMYTGYKEGEDNRCCKNGCGSMYRDVHHS